MLKDWADKTKDNSSDMISKINGWGVYGRFITPLFGILATIIGTLALTTLTDIKKAQEGVRIDLTTYQKEARVYNENHLAHHSKQEIEVAGRLASIETELRRLK